MVKANPPSWPWGPRDLGKVLGLQKNKRARLRPQEEVSGPPWGKRWRQGSGRRQVLFPEGRQKASEPSTGAGRPKVGGQVKKGVPCP